MKFKLPFGPGYRAEPPSAPQKQGVVALAPRGLVPVSSAGDSWREHRRAQNMEVDPWHGVPLYGAADGGMNYGPPPNPAYHSFEIPRIFNGSMQGWAGLQQIGYVQDQRGSSNGYGAYIPHAPYLFAGRGYRSISMIYKNTGFKEAGRMHVPAIFVPTAPLS